MDLTGTTLGQRYRLVRTLGAGAVGAVYEGLEVASGRRFAIKLLQTATPSANELERFRREAHALAALGNVHIVQLLDFRTDPGEMPYLVMELLEGESLGSLLARIGTLRADRVVDYAIQALDALAAAHAAGVVHRDVKIDNLFLAVPRGGGTEVLKVVDFGVAKLVQPDVGALTAEGMVVGTLGYLSPEQASGQPVDGRADLYALGVCMYVALSGKMPVTESTFFPTLQRIVNGDVVPLESVAPHADARLATLVHKALARDREARFPSAAAMQTALLAYQRGGAIEATLASAAPEPTRLAAEPGNAAATAEPSYRSHAAGPSQGSMASEPSYKSAWGPGSSPVGEHPRKVPPGKAESPGGEARPVSLPLALAVALAGLAFLAWALLRTPKPPVVAAPTAQELSLASGLTSTPGPSAPAVTATTATALTVPDASPLPVARPHSPHSPALPTALPHGGSSAPVPPASYAAPCGSNGDCSADRVCTRGGPSHGEKACRACAEVRPGTTFCGAPHLCADLRVDPEHCGRCGLSCGGGRTCAGGACVVAMPLGARCVPGQCATRNAECSHNGVCECFNDLVRCDDRCVQPGRCNPPKNGPTEP